MAKTKHTSVNVLVTGASGLIGSALVPFLKQHGFTVNTLSRKKNNTTPYWNIEQKQIHLNGLSEPDIIIHLAGENIAKRRWSKKIKAEIVNSRLLSTQLLVDHINNSLTPPSLFICASAIGFYGDCGNQLVDEKSSRGNAFVSKLAEQWEKVSQQIEQSATRVVNLRSGIVLSKKEGALAKMYVPFKLGLGGRIGHGQQIMSWIDLQDELNAILFIINHPSLYGAINLVSPNAVTNQVFSSTLATLLKRPCYAHLPIFMVKLLFAEMGEELLLSSTHVLPTKLLQAGFIFEYPQLQESLRQQLLIIK